VLLINQEAVFPDSGGSATRIEAARSGIDPCDSWECCPLSTTHNSRRVSHVVRLLLGCLAFTAVTVSAQGQTYYYYPSSVPATPTITTGTTAAPAYYRRGLFGNRVVWTTPAVQYSQAQYTTPTYQTSYTPQNYQPTYQTQVAQTTTDAQVVPASNTASTAAPAATEATTTVSMDAGDPYGFTGWLNATRASYGLAPVGHDPNLSGWAAVNNTHQAARGMGHFVMGPARRQNSAVGSFANIGAMWMNSPAHRAALLDPTIRWIGIAGLGAYWTFDAY
jgi:uncharacterized protein YkwD